MPIEIANKYTGLALAERPVILKLHGAIDRDDAKRDSYVLTEDSYIDYLAGPFVGDQIPFSLMAKMEDEPLPFPRLLDARLEHARDPEAAVGRRASSAASRGRCSSSRPATARARSRRSSGAAAATSTCIYAPLREYVERLERRADRGAARP